MDSQVQDELNKLKIQVSLIERDIVSLTKVSEKISTSIEKIQEFNTNVIKIVSICEQRHNSHEDTEDETKAEIKEFQGNLNLFSKEFTDRLNQLENQLTIKIDGLKDDVSKVTTELSALPSKESLLGCIRSKYLVVGGAAVVGWIVANLKSVKEFLSIFEP